MKSICKDRKETETSLCGREEKLYACGDPLAGWRK